MRPGSLSPAAKEITVCRFRPACVAGDGPVAAGGGVARAVRVGAGGGAALGSKENGTVP